MSQIDERKINPTEEIERVAQNLLNVKYRGFKESYRSAKPGKIIYDSELCRLSIIWGGWDYRGGNSIQIRYGRLHASNEKITMIWNGEECRCWHRVEHPLHFLDGRTPAETAEFNYSHTILKPFYEAEYRKKFNRRQPEWLANMHTTIWQKYGQYFFDLFDLRRSDLWQQYRQFLKEVYDISGRASDVEPPLDKVC